MRARPVRLLVGIAAAAVAAFAGAYFLFFTPDSPDPLTLSQNPGTTAADGTGAVATGDLAGLWTVASGSEARYRAQEKLAALPARSEAVGRTSALTGQVRLDDIGGAVTATEARFEADLTQLRSDDQRRDNRIRTQGLESGRFPTATFVATEPLRVPGLPPAGQPAQVSAVGDLTIHGVTKRVTIPIEGQLLGDRIELVGALEFPMSDFGISPPNIAGFVTVEPDVTLEFKLVLSRT
ncbi:MAG: YceI family protein [Acidimicrobiia bacterium]